MVPGEKRSDDVQKPDYFPPVPQNTASNVQTPRTGREITGQLETKQK